MPALTLATLGFCLAAYLVGAIPFGLLITRAIAGVDVRDVGSGNIGATNAVRAGGKLAGALTLLCDALKGLLPTWLALRELGVGAAALAGACAFLGHLYPLYLRFRGGKGVAIALGIFLALSPWAALGALSTYAAVLGATRVSALGSLAAVAAALGLVIALHAPTATIALCAFLTVLIVWRHRANLAALRRRSVRRAEP
ncbi:MAG: glycerol-3-phosphate 1-O-acyltransferase PlsY [Deltaproteobacteria bacterium]